MKQARAWTFGISKASQLGNRRKNKTPLTIFSMQTLNNPPQR